VRLNWYRPRPPSRARAHANANAGPGGAAERTPAPQDKGPVGALMEMGLGDRGMVTAALKACGGSAERAVAHLLGGPEASALPADRQRAVDDASRRSPATSTGFGAADHQDFGLLTVCPRGSGGGLAMRPRLNHGRRAGWAACEVDRVEHFAEDCTVFKVRAGRDSRRRRRRRRRRRGGALCCAARIKNTGRCIVLAVATHAHTHTCEWLGPLHRGRSRLGR
jgi:hypothetical protein